MRKKVVLLALLLAAAAFVVVLLVRNPEAPPMPRDAAHAGGPVEGCLTCHGPDGPSPRGPNHTPRRDCFQCHAFAR